MATKQFTFRLDTELKAALERLAKVESRTVSNLLKYIIMQYIARHECGGDQ